jgi:tetratricopeptide (TPR) repeat protein
VHPLRAESVAWVTERRDVLSGLFVLLALLAYVERPAGPRPRVVVLAALALLAKASAMVLPGFLLVLDVYPLRRIGGDAGWTSPAARRVLREKLPFVALAAVAGVAALAGQRRAGALVPLAHVSAGARLGTAMYQAGFYLWKTLLPIGLQPLYEAPPGMGPFHPLALAGAATGLALGAAAWVFRKRWPGLGAAAAVYLIGFAPTNGVVQAGWQVAADRYTYLPALAWAPLVAAVVARPPALRTVRTAVAGGAVLLAAVATVRQVGFWRDSITLWERALALAPQSAIVHDLLARAYLDAGRGDDAVELFESWLRRDPGNASGWGYYGVMLANAGADERALPVLEKALALDAANASAYYARGLVRDRGGDSVGALADYDEALRLDPALGSAYHNRGLVRRKRGDSTGALEDFARALDFDQVRSAPNAFATYANYGLVLAERGQLDAALDALGTAVTLAPPESRAKIEELRTQLEARRDPR